LLPNLRQRALCAQRSDAAAHLSTRLYTRRPELVRATTRRLGRPRAGVGSGAGGPTNLRRTTDRLSDAGRALLAQLLARPRALLPLILPHRLFTALPHRR